MRAIIQRKLDDGTANPVADAADAARRGEFGLIVTGRFGATPPGVTCFTPYRAAPGHLVLYRHGDGITEPEMQWLTYADAYNRALVNRPDYPDADLCRAAVEGDRAAAWTARDLTVAARPVSGPPRTLHEAARRGGRADIARLLRTVPIDELDPFGMTALAWAVARNNGEAVETLLHHAANPWFAGSDREDSAVFWAAALGRRTLFERLVQLPGRSFDKWPQMYLNAALSGGDPAVVSHLLAEPHAVLRIEMLARPLPSSALLEPVLRGSPQLAAPLLREALASEGRPDLVRLALTMGADPNAQPPQMGQDTPLGMVANGIYPSSVENVDLLLRAGANPNMPSHRDRPLWIAIRSLRLDGEDNEFDQRALAILDRLIAAGGDINLPNYEGRPPAWMLFFPYSYARREMDASFVTPALLEKLVQRGLNLNAVWEGERILSLVEEQAGRDSDLAVALRRLGARR